MVVMKSKTRHKRTGVTGIDAVLKFAAKGDLPAVKRALAEKPTLLNAMSEGHHRTFLWEAANRNRMEVVKYLVRKGADVNIPGRYRSETFVLLTPYCIAEKRKRKKIAEFLLAHETELDIYSAAFLGDLGLLKKWVSRKASLVNASHPEDSAWDVIPLHYAIAGEQIEAAKFLISKKTKVSKHSELLLDIACRLDRMDLIQLLVGAGADPARVEVFSVVYKGSFEIMEFFFKKGVDTNKKGKVTGWPPIAYVSRGDKGEHPEKVKSLIKYGAAVDATGPKGVTALHAAAKAGFLTVIEVLLDAGANINAKTDAGETPLCLSKKHKRTAASKLLEKSGAV
jgi:ankyrin repeat protein